MQFEREKLEKKKEERKKKSESVKVNSRQKDRKIREIIVTALNTIIIFKSEIDAAKNITLVPKFQEN